MDTFQRIFARALLMVASLGAALIVLSAFAYSVQAGKSSGVLATCQTYTRPGNITHVVLNYHFKDYDLPASVMETISMWQGESLWSGYQSVNPFGISKHAKLVANLHFTVIQNLVNNRYFFNDPDEIWFLDDGRKDEVVMFPFISLLHPFADSKGQHFGSHLCGDYAISRSDFEEILPAANRLPVTITYVSADHSFAPITEPMRTR